MKKTIILKGLDCASCAANLEDKLKKIQGIKDASINFLMGKLNLELENEDTEILDKAIKVIKKAEPSVKIEM